MAYSYPPYVTGFGKTCIVHISNFAHLGSIKATGNVEQINFQKVYLIIDF